MLRSDKPISGLFLKLPATDVVDLAQGAGFDFAIVDLEHSQLTEGDALRLVAHGRALGFPLLVRLPQVDPGLVNRLLEAGARGIQLSTVRRADQIQALRRASRYAPHGGRSISLAHAGAGFGAVPVATYLRDTRAPLLVAQLETARTDDPLEDILAAGADVAFVGSLDLLVDVELDAAACDARIAEIAAAARRAGVALGGYRLDHPDVRFDVRHSDLGLLREAAQHAG
jgi:4-hydroxy-2-oxoheptanedioate aldolase